MSTYRFDVERTSISRGNDPILVSSIILLTGIGLVTLYSASSGFAERFFGDSLYFLKKQLIFGGLGIVLFILGVLIDLKFLRNLVKPMVLGAILLCLLTFIPGIGMMKNGASRWIRIGSSSYQPSELVKIVLPIYLAHIFSKKEDRMEDASSSVLPPAIVTALFCLLIYFQNNFSTSAFIAANAIVLFFLAGVKIRHFVAVALVSLPLGALLVFTKEHRVRRLLTFLRPEWDPLGAGYQVSASLTTVASGGLWGKGLGQGTRKIASVPEIHSDFVFASFSEEAGYIGVVLLFALFALFAVRGYRSALRSQDSFRRLLASGLVTVMAGQALLNVAVVIGAVPATGIPLPFFSAGGSSLATTLFAAGLVVNVSRTADRLEASNV